MSITKVLLTFRSGDQANYGTNLAEAQEAACDLSRRPEAGGIGDEIMIKIEYDEQGPRAELWYEGDLKLEGPHHSVLRELTA